MPMCLKVVDTTKIKIENETSKYFKSFRQKGKYLLVIGTKEGSVLVQKLDTQKMETKLILQTKKELVHRGVTAIDVSRSGDSMVIATGAAEIITFDLFQKLNKSE